MTTPKTGAQEFTQDLRRETVLSLLMTGRRSPIAKKMKACPNNPNNGGSGYDSFLRGDKLGPEDEGWWV